MSAKKKKTTKKPETFTCLWFYPGGTMHREEGSESHIDSFAKDIIKCGGSATKYRGKV
jgi:hypothetical protein